MQGKRPNILFILADDLGQGDVSCFNPSCGWTTPHMDALASEGMRFTDSHATSSMCTPSRYAALTGRYNWRSRLKSGVLTGDSMALIERDRLTLAQFLKDRGYRTAVVGKWHLGLDWHLHDDADRFADYGIDPQDFRLPEGRQGRDGNFDPANRWLLEGLDIDYTQPVKFGPNEMGFDYSFITPASLDQPPYVYVENGRALGQPSEMGGDQFKLDRRTDSQAQDIQRGPMVPGYDIDRVVEDFQAKALDVLDENLAGEDPWFLYVPSHLVHGPIIPNKPWQGRSGKGAYGDWVLQFDSYVGQLVDRIDAAGQAENTIVIVTSDNGPSGVAGIDALRAQGHDPANGWRGIKSDIWEGGHREPFLVRWPGHIEAGAVSGQTVSHVDVFATVAELLGADVPDDAAEDSFSNLPLWEGEDAPVRTSLVSSSRGGGFALRRGDWKLEMVTTGDGMDAFAAETSGEGPVTEYRAGQLYNLAQDPTESVNVIDEHPDLVADLTQELADIITRGRSTEGPDRLNDEDTPSGRWRQIAWMSGADSLKTRHVPA